MEAATTHLDAASVYLFNCSEQLRATKQPYGFLEGALAGMVKVVDDLPSDLRKMTTALHGIAGATHSIHRGLSYGALVELEQAQGSESIGQNPTLTTAIRAVHAIGNTLVEGNAEGPSQTTLAMGVEEDLRAVGEHLKAIKVLLEGSRRKVHDMHETTLVMLGQKTGKQDTAENSSIPGILDDVTELKRSIR